MNPQRHIIMLLAYLKETESILWLFDECIKELDVYCIEEDIGGYTITLSYGESYREFETTTITHRDLQTWLFEKVVKLGETI